MNINELNTLPDGILIIIDNNCLQWRMLLKCRSRGVLKVKAFNLMGSSDGMWRVLIGCFYIHFNVSSIRKSGEKTIVYNTTRFLLGQ